MDERGRRQWAAAEAQELGWGGVSAVARATRLSRTTITAGLRELELPAAQRVVEGMRVRRPGGGRKALIETDPGLPAALEALIEPVTRGDPESPLRWTCKSTRRLADELTRERHPVSVNTVATLLRQAGYSLQANRKTREGASHPDRNAQFEHINRQVWRFQDRDQPAISVDTKKKELIGDFKNGGREWRPRGKPEEVRVHDFLDKELGKAIPYGVYDMINNQGWVSVGIDHDTAQFAVNSIRRWWRRMGRRRFPRAAELLITTDGGGSNSPRSRLWKVSLQSLADELGLRLHVCHFPPGTSKWNRIEHRLFSFITKNWRGRPLVTHQAVVSLIAGTTTRTGLIVKAALDTNRYDTAIKVTDDQLRLTPHPFHGEWNYTLTPRGRN
ncbi:MAG: ISAzo13 family transposase [Phycisphaerae bacterium]|nr:ISAzo13 family transposase [Phycisphaerae bacterium]